MSTTSISVASVSKWSAKAIRVRFSTLPVMASSVAANDALNPSNYSVVGPIANTITTIRPASGDPQAVDVVLSVALSEGLWTVNVSNVETADGSSLEAPTSASFTITDTTQISPLSNGVTTDSAEKVLRRHFPSVFEGKNWDAMIAGFATAHSYLSEFGQNAFDQLFPSTASGVYLDRHANASRVTRPAKVGFSDEQFRKLLIRVSARKLTIPAILGVLEVFYGSEALRANITPASVEPYALEDGDDLTLRFEGKSEVVVLFNEEDFDDISNATAAELSAVYTRTFRHAGLKAYAVPMTDPVSGDTSFIIFSAALGLNSSIEVLGGKAQNTFLFSTKVDTVGEVSLAWSVTAQPTGTDYGTVRLKTTSGSTAFDVQQVHIGDYVNIYGSPFNAANRGSFTITDVVKSWNGSTFDQYVDFVNVDAVTQATVTQIAESDVLFFRPTKNGIYKDSDRTVVVAQTERGKIEVKIPATSSAISRTQNTGAYGNINDALDVDTVSREAGGTFNVVTNVAHGLSVGNQLLVDALAPEHTVLPVTAVSPSNPGDSSYSLRSHVAELTLMAGSARRFGTAFQINDSVYIVGGTDALAVPSLDFETNFPTTDTTDFTTIAWTNPSPAYSGTAFAQTNSALAGFGAVGMSAHAGTGFIHSNNRGVANSTSSVRATVTLVAAGQIDFWYRTGSEAINDLARISIDGVQVVSHGGADTGWVHYTSAVLTVGEHTVDFRYTKNGSTDSFGDALMVDDMTVVYTTAGASNDVDKLALTASTVGGAIQYAYEWTHDVGLDYPSATQYPRSCVMQDGRALVVGGGTDDVTSLATSYFFDETAWTSAGTLAYERQRHGIAHRDPSLGDGSWTVDMVVAVGGLGSTSVLRNEIESLVSTGGGWSYQGGITLARYDHGCVALTNGNVLVVGGVSSISTAERNCELVTFDSDIYMGTFPVGSLSRGRANPVVIAIPDGRAIVIGGGSDAASNECEVFDPRTSRWEPGPKLKNARNHHNAVLIDSTDGGKTILVTGGANEPEILDLVEWKWKSATIEGTMPSTRMDGYLVAVDSLHAVSASGLVSELTLTSEMFLQGFRQSWAGRVNGFGYVTAVDSSTEFSFKLHQSGRGYTSLVLTDATIVPVGARAASIPGPFIFDKEGASVTSTQTTSTMKLETGKHYTALTVSDATDFPDEEGFISLGFGTEGAVFPIRYLGRQSNTALLLDYTTSFAKDIQSGTTVTLLHERGSWTPDAPETLGCLYATASPAGRVAAQQTVNDIAAAGMDMNVVIKYPGDRGLSGAGKPTVGVQKLSSVVSVFADDDVDAEVVAAQEEIL